MLVGDDESILIDDKARAGTAGQLPKLLHIHLDGHDSRIDLVVEVGQIAGPCLSGYVALGAGQGG